MLNTFILRLQNYTIYYKHFVDNFRFELPKLQNTDLVRTKLVNISGLVDYQKGLWDGEKAMREEYILVVE